MPYIPELDSPLPTPFLVPSRRQIPPPNGPPRNTNPDSVVTVPRTSATNTITASLVSTAATATYSAVNSMSLVIDPSATSTRVNGKVATPTQSIATPTSQSTAEELFTPNGGLFAAGVVILGLAVLALFTCGIVTVRCTLRNRRRSRARSRAQSFAEKNVTRRKMSSDRVSEFWSADANGPIRGRAITGDIASTQHPPTRPARIGETGVDLRTPGVVHFSPSVTMSDHTGLSTDVQLHGSARNSEANDANLPNPPPAVAVAQTNPILAAQLGRHMSFTLDQDPFAASPMVPMPTTAYPLLPAHETAFPPPVSNSPHTVNNSSVTPSSRLPAHFNYSPSNPAPSSSQTASVGSSLGSTNTLGLSSSSYLADATIPLGTPTSGVMYRSGVDSLVSDPFAYDSMAQSRPPTFKGAHTIPPPSPGGTWTDVNLGVTSPRPLHIAKRSPGIPVSPLSSSYLAPPSPLSVSHPSSPALAQAHPSLGIQSDVSRALSQLQRRVSVSSVATRFSQQTEYQYRPTLNTVPDNDGFFMYPSPGNSRQSRPFVPGFKVTTPPEPETLQMQPTKTKSETGSPVYSSTISVFDSYYQESEYNSRSRSGTQNGPR